MSVYPMSNPAHYDIDTVLYVAIAGLQAFQTIEHWQDPKSWAGVLMVCLIAWKTKRSPGKEDGQIVAPKISEPVKTGTGE